MQNVVKKSVVKKRSLLRESTQELLNCLKWTARKLKTPEEFEMLTESQQQDRVGEGKRKHVELRERGFTAIVGGEEDETDASSTRDGAQDPPAACRLSEQDNHMGHVSEPGPLRRTLTPPLAGLPSTSTQGSWESRGTSFSSPQEAPRSRASSTPLRGAGLGSPL